MNHEQALPNNEDYNRLANLAEKFALPVSEHVPEDPGWVPIQGVNIHNLDPNTNDGLSLRAKFDAMTNRQWVLVPTYESDSDFFVVGLVDETIKTKEYPVKRKDGTTAIFTVIEGGRRDRSPRATGRGVLRLVESPSEGSGYA